MSICLIIPCYNVSNHINNVVSAIPDNVNNIILVNDASTDLTVEVLNNISASNPKVIILNHDKNKGVGGAMKSGFTKALQLNCQYIVKLDGDGQMEPLFIEKVVAPLKNNTADYTKGNRFYDFEALRQMPIIRRLGNLGLSFLIKAASGYWNIFDPTNGFIAIKSSLLKKMNVNRLDDRYFFESSFLIELYYFNAIIKDVPMKAIYKDERSNLSPIHSLFTFPLKLFGAFIRRIILKYFLYDFNIASLYFLFGIPLFTGGSVIGLKSFIKYTSLQIPAPTGTVVIPVLLIILGFQLLLSALHFDINNYPSFKNDQNTPD